MTTETIRYTRRPDMDGAPIWYSDLNSEEAGICDNGLRHQFNYPKGATKIWIEITDEDPEDEEAMRIFRVTNCSLRCQDQRGIGGVACHDLYKPFYWHIKGIIENLEDVGWMRVWY